MYGYVYITTNVINGKKYIGQHKSEYFDESYKGSGKYLRNAINKYGYDNFVVELIEECESVKDLNDRERYWISFYNAVNSNMFYNLADGKGQGSGTHNSMYGLYGENNPNYGSKRTDEQKANMSKAKLGNKSLRGLKAINNGVSNKYVKPELISYYLDNGWSEGVKPFSEERCINISVGVSKSLKNPNTIKKKSENMEGNKFGLGNRSTKGMIHITNGKENHNIFPDELEEWKLKGFYKGFTMNRHRKKVIDDGTSNTA